MASSKEALRKKITGYNIEVEATEYGDISWNELTDKCKKCDKVWIYSCWPKIRKLLKIENTFQNNIVGIHYDMNKFEDIQLFLMCS